MNNRDKGIRTVIIILVALIAIGVLKASNLGGALEITIVDLVALVAIVDVWRKKKANED